MSQRKQKINKLYYGKWPFKIECYLPKASMIVRLGASDTRLWAKGKVQTWQKATTYEKDEVIKFLNAIECYLDKEVQIRAEGGHFNFFCKDRALKNAIIKDTKQWLRTVHGPDTDEELEFMLSSGRKKLVCSNLPYDKYRYKLNFKTNMPINVRPKFLEWANKYNSKTAIADSTQRWLEGRTSYVQAPFMYVEDDKTLAMFGLFLGNHVRIVEEFILRSSINTSLDQEIPCQHLVKV
jgi:hypothetical protein